MTAAEHLTLKTLLLYPQESRFEHLPTYRLLHELGHEVNSTNDTDRAMNLLGDEAIDLMVVDVANDPGGGDIVRALSDLPGSAQPRQLALYTDRLDEATANLRQRFPRGRVHVFLKPLHMHGLLSVLRGIQGEAIAHS